MSKFTKATKKKRKLRMCLAGPSGSGKTFTALHLMRELVGPQGSIAVIDTERQSAALYAEYVDFDTAPITHYGVNDYIDLLRDASDYDGIIIDSLSHAWEGDGGILARVEEIKKVKQYRDGMRAWNDIKPEETKLWNAILDFPGHLIATMRAKQSYEISKDDKGKTVVEKLGLSPIQRSDKEYEFDVVGMMDIDNVLSVSKSRCPEIAGKAFTKPKGEVAAILKNWLDTGEDAPVPFRETELKKMAGFIAKHELNGDDFKAEVAQHFGTPLTKMDDDTLAKVLPWAEARLHTKQTEEPVEGEEVAV